MGKHIHKLTNKDLVNKTADCSNCGLVRINIRNNGRNVNCAYSHTYGSKSSAVRPSLNDCCEICGAKTKLVYDHNHKTGTHRGWLCRSCNLMLGYAMDDINILTLAVRYLQR